MCTVSIHSPGNIFLFGGFLCQLFHRATRDILSLALLLDGFLVPVQGRIQPCLFTPTASPHF